MSKHNAYRRTLIASAAATCFAGLAPSAIAQEIRRARRAGRPLFTADALNAMIPSPSDPGYAAFLEAAALDIKGFVRARFTLSAQQELELAAITAADLALLQTYLRRAGAERMPVRFEIASSANLIAAPRNRAEGLEAASGPAAQDLQSRQDAMRRAGQELEAEREEMEDRADEDKFFRGFFGDDHGARPPVLYEVPLRRDATAFTRAQNAPIIPK